ncbi:MAG: FAD-dependent oxidoreductase, partial [Vitreoscilla sp.]|nr:FAD-dependent oxidoreductase [Vitreoscilla sp.]
MCGGRRRCRCRVDRDGRRVVEPDRAGPVGAGDRLDCTAATPRAGHRRRAVAGRQLRGGGDRQAGHPVPRLLQQHPGAALPAGCGHRLAGLAQAERAGRRISPSGLAHAKHVELIAVQIAEVAGVELFATRAIGPLVLGAKCDGLLVDAVHHVLGLHHQRHHHAVAHGGRLAIERLGQHHGGLVHGRFDNVMLNTKTVAAEATPEGIKVSFAPAKDGVTVPEPQVYDLVLQAVGRTPNGKKIAADKAGVAVTDRGFINVDIQMRTNVPHIFAIGDIVGQPMLAHKAVHEAHVAAEVIAGELQGNKELASAAFNARVIPSVAYTDPEVAWVGLT